MVPPHYQVLFVNVVGFFWTIYLTYMSFKSQGKGAELVNKELEKITGVDVVVEKVVEDKDQKKL